LAHRPLHAVYSEYDPARVEGYQLTLGRALTNQHKPAGLRVYITGDGSDVYEDLVMKAAKVEDEKFQPILVLVGIRLGIERITPVYWKGLQDILRMPQSVGIAGWV
jgi:cysteine protease ATG4